MRCPYCAEEIKDEAIACKHCGRDFFVIQPLLAKLNAAELRIKTLEGQIADFGEGRPPDGIKKNPVAATATERTAQVATALDDRVPSLPGWATVALTFVMLVAAHFVIIILFDLNLIYLRIASMAIPLAFGFLYRNAMDRSLFLDLATGIVIAIIAILAMSVVVAKVDRVPILPQNAHGWREYAEYSASIGFGFFTGCVLRHGLMVARAPSAQVSFAVELAARFISQKLNKNSGDDPVPADRIDLHLKKIQTWVTGGMAAASAITSVYTGLSGLIH